MLFRDFWNRDTGMSLTRFTGTFTTKRQWDTNDLFENVRWRCNS